MSGNRDRNISSPGKEVALGKLSYPPSLYEEDAAMSSSA